MEVILCNEHGRQFARLVCPHLQESYKRRSRPVDISPIRGFFIDPSISTALFWCCSGCSHLYGFGKENIDFVDLSDEFLDKLSPICKLCFEAWQNNQLSERH